MRLRLITQFRPALLAVSAVALTVGVDDPEIVFGVLKIVLGGDAIARCLRVAGERQILLEHLVGVATDPHLGSVAVECLVLRRHMRLTVAAAAGAP